MINADPAPPLARADLARAIDAAGIMLGRYARSNSATGVIVGPETLRILLAAADVLLGLQPASVPATAPPDTWDGWQDPEAGFGSQGATAGRPVLGPPVLGLGRDGMPVTFDVRESLPAWMCHDGAGHFFVVVHPDHVDRYPGRPNDQVPPWARLLLVSDSAGNPLPVDGEVA